MAKKTIKKIATKSKKKKVAKKQQNRKVNAAFMKLLRPSKDLAKILEQSTNRSEALKKVVEYIKKNTIIKNKVPTLISGPKKLKSTKRKVKAYSPGIGGGRRNET